MVLVVFNFVTGQHDVAKVTKAAFDACSTGSTIFTLNNGPASVKLNESGEQYYICTFGSHCSLGQKVAINVTKEASSSASPAPAPQTKAVSPAPVKAPSPAPSASAPSPSSTGSVTYTVGDKTGWTVPSGAPAFYKTWTSGKTFKLGDILGKKKIIDSNLEATLLPHFLNQSYSYSYIFLENSNGMVCHIFPILIK